MNGHQVRPSQQSMNNRRKFVVALGVGTLGIRLRSFAQQPAAKIYRIGILTAGYTTADLVGPRPAAPPVNAFLRGLSALGYVYGQHFVTEPPRDWWQSSGILQACVVGRSLKQPLGNAGGSCCCLKLIVQDRSKVLLKPRSQRESALCLSSEAGFFFRKASALPSWPSRINCRRYIQIGRLPKRAD